MSLMSRPTYVQENIELAPYTSWLVGGPAQFFATPTTLDEVRGAVQWAEANAMQITVLGGGTNVLVSDHGISGLVVCLRKLSGLQTREVNQRLEIEAWAGTGKSELLKVFLKHQLAPALFLAGLPGDVGGGVMMNAGVSEAMTPREFVEIVDWIEVLPLGNQEIRVWRKDELQWSYRHSRGWGPGLIVRVGLSWPLEPVKDLLTQVREANRIRLSKQPLHLPSCGSVFVNPPGHKAGALIDRCGLRGFQIGGAQVSEKHANFIVNTGSATASDILQVITHVQQTVRVQKGVELHTEVVLLGDR